MVILYPEGIDNCESDNWVVTQSPSGNCKRLKSDEQNNLFILPMFSFTNVLINIKYSHKYPLKKSSHSYKTGVGNGCHIGKVIHVIAELVMHTLLFPCKLRTAKSGRHEPVLRNTINESLYC